MLLYLLGLACLPANQILYWSSIPHEGFSIKFILKFHPNNNHYFSLVSTYYFLKMKTFYMLAMILEIRERVMNKTYSFMALDLKTFISNSRWTCAISGNVPLVGFMNRFVHITKANTFKWFFSTWVIMWEKKLPFLPIEKAVTCGICLINVETLNSTHLKARSWSSL